MKSAIALGLILLTPLVAACAESPPPPPAPPAASSDGDPTLAFSASGDGTIGVVDGAVVITADGIDARARVTADGRLEIGRKAVNLNDAERRALRDYASAAVAMHEHGRALGRAGAKFGVSVLADVFSGLIDGDAEAAGSRARAGAADFVASAAAICDRLAALEAAQRTASDRVPAFAPYAVIEAGQAVDCRRELDEAEADLARDAGADSER